MKTLGMKITRLPLNRVKQTHTWCSYEYDFKYNTSIKVTIFQYPLVLMPLSHMLHQCLMLGVKSALRISNKVTEAVRAINLQSFCQIILGSAFSVSTELPSLFTVTRPPLIIAKKLFCMLTNIKNKLHSEMLIQ
ncbi:hypothetical protein ILYODFUR_005478 [Ilyodon furcidens]|uniref:Uncharacterized protein n=1 Tax=Ilyodon furcidens TaxID=33524 RepID=A0ABV0UPN4_9TELE